VWKRILSVAAAAAMALGGPLVAPPEADPYAAVQEVEYGAPRPSPSIEVWGRVFQDWTCAQGIRNPAAGWSKVGTTVTYTVTESMGGETEVSKLTVALTDLGKQSGALKLTPDVGRGAQRALDLQHKFTLKPKEVKEEEVTADGKKFKCQAKTYDRMTIWWCDDAPGGFVKIKAGEETLEIDKLSEDVSIGGKKYACSVWKRVSGGREIREWRTDKVPGGVARWEQTVKDGPLTVMEVTSFSEGK
jgi:hypothetical protein